MQRFDFRKIVERLPLVLYVDELDARSTPLYISPQIANLLGYTPEEWLANPDLFVESLHPDDRARVLAAIAERNRTQETVPSPDYRLINRDGEVVWVHDDEIVVESIDGSITAAHGYLRDVTAQRSNAVRTELLARVLSLAAEELPPQQLIAETADALASAFGDVRVTFVELTPDRHTRPLYSTRPGGVIDSVRVIDDVFERLRQGPLVIEDVYDEPWLRHAWEELERVGVRSAVDVPLRRNGEIVAVMWFNTVEPRRWTDDEVRTLTEVAEQLAVVLERAEAREQRLKADRIVEAVSGSAHAFLTDSDLDGAVVELMRRLGEATSVAGAWLFENLPGEGDLPYCLRRAGWSAGEIVTTADPRFGHVRPAPHWPRWAAILGGGETIAARVRDLPQDERDAFAVLNMLSVIAVPIFVDDTWWGFIGFDDTVAERDWSAAELDALRAAAGLVAAALSRERAERDLRRRDAVLQAVSKIAERLLSERSWRDAANEILQALGAASEASRAYLFERLPSGDGRLRMAQRFEWVAPGITPEIDNPAMQDFFLDEAGLVGQTDRLQRQEPFAVTVSELPEGERAFYESQRIRSMLVVPVVLDGEVWGTIGFDDCVTERDWNAAEVDALRTAASLLAAAIERERAESVLREHEQKLRAVFDTAFDAIFITDDERRYVDANPAACEFVGISKRDLIGRRIDEFLPPHKLERLDEEWAVYLRGGAVLEEWETQRADGRVRIAQASAQPQFLPGLNIAFLRDITDRKRLEADLLSAQKLESLGRLAGGVAHDFNNLLTGITGYASLLLERADGDEEFQRDLSEIKRAADRAAELTRQLLAFGRRQVLKPQQLDLNDVVDDVFPLLDRLLGGDVVLERRTTADLGIVRADPGQVEQVIVNLAVNAGDAMPNGGRLEIETRNADDGFVELVVRDTGIGMDEETAAQIFEPFYTTREQGVGLGLASVYGIVTQSGGDVDVESAPGCGSVFTVRLPRVAAAAGAEEAPPAAPAARPGSETILLVEDENVVRELTRRVLERQGYTVLACADGAEAIGLAAELDEPIDLLLTDVVMPGLRGWEVAQRISESRPEIKVLYMSGYAEEALVGSPALAGSALIEKPFAVDALAARVREALDVTVAA